MNKLSSSCYAQESARTSDTNAKLNQAWILWVKTHSAHRAQILELDFLAHNIPFAQALPANVAVTPLKPGKVNCYIDNFIPVVLHSGDNVERSANTIPLNMHTLGRPVHPNEPISWEDLICFCKLFCEGQLAEIKTVTDWGIDTCWFLVFLTNDK